jgi:glycerol-3-phosphate acyltransferase PlsY
MIPGAELADAAARQPVCSLAAFLLSILAGSVLGSIPFGYAAGRVNGIDIRTKGSGNIGFTNVQRTLGWGWALPVLILDVAKGMVPAALAPLLGLNAPLVGLGAILGHVFTPWLGFRGGKGVATTIGVAAVLCFWSLLPGLCVYIGVLLATGFISLSSLALAVLLPVLTALIYHEDTPLLIFTAGVGAVVFIRHLSNIKRLAAGTEPRLNLWLKLFKRT